jgi:hypothetical protein
MDSRGKDLIDLRISNQLRIVNDRVLGDTFGNFTCYTTHGASTVDYVLVLEGILDHILSLKVNDFVPCQPTLALKSPHNKTFPRF